MPPPCAVKGEAFSYQVAARGRMLPLRFDLVEGPDGMTVDAAGVVRWSPAARFDQPEVRVIVEVRDAQQRSTYHTFDLPVRRADRPPTQAPPQATLSVWSTSSASQDPFVVDLYRHDRVIYRARGAVYKQRNGQVRPATVPLPRMAYDRIRVRWTGVNRSDIAVAEIRLSDEEGDTLLDGLSPQTSGGDPSPLIDGVTDGTKWVVKKGTEAWVEFAIQD